MRGRGSHGREEEQGRERRRSSVGSAAAGGALSCLLGDEHGRQGAEALREREERCSGTRGLLMLSRVAWTGKATGRRSVLTIHSGSSRGGKRRLEQRREKEARPRALVGGRWIWEDPEVGFECGGGGGGILGSWSRVCPNRHVGGLDVDYIYGKGGELDHPIKIRRSRIDRLGKSK